MKVITVILRCLDIRRLLEAGEGARPCARRMQDGGLHSFSKQQMSTIGPNSINGIAWPNQALVVLLN